MLDIATTNGIALPILQPTNHCIKITDIQVRRGRDNVMTIRILVLSNNKNILESVKDELSPLGHHVITCTSSALAMYLSNKNFPSVVIADQSTDSNAKDFIAQLKADDQLCSIPVVVLSEPADPTNWHTLGAAGCVIKPIRSGVLAYELAPFLREVKDSRSTETPE